MGREDEKTIGLLKEEPDLVVFIFPQTSSHVWWGGPSSLALF